MNIFDTFLVNPLINLLVIVYHGLLSVHAPGVLGLSIILSTIIIRLILYPFTTMQIKTAQKMQEIQPHLNRLKEIHKGNPQKLQQEQVALFKEHGVNPVAGCLPTLIQIIFLFGFYSAIAKLVTLKPDAALAFINKIIYFDAIRLKEVWATDFFGLSLIKAPSHVIQNYGFLILLIPILTGVLQLIQTKMMMPEASKVPSPVNKSKTDKKGEPNFAQTMQSQMLLMTPVIIGVVSYQFALGLSLYWNTFTIFGIIQQYRTQGLGGLKDWIAKLPWKKQN